jgi:hypothetical protein
MTMAPDAKAKALAAHLGAGTSAFDWHGANCAHFCGAYIEQIEGRDPLAGFEMPASQTQARRLLAKAKLADLVSAQLGRAPIAPAFAQIGDLMLLPLSDSDPLALALGLCAGDAACARTEHSGAISFVPSASALCAWRVGGPP